MDKGICHATHNNRSSIPGSYFWVTRENRYHKFVLWPPSSHYGVMPLTSNNTAFKIKAKQQEPKSFLVYFFEWVLIRLSHLIQNSETGRVSAHSHKHESSWLHLMFLMLSLLETLSPGTSRNSVSKPSGYSFTYSSPHTIKHNVWNSSKMWKCKWLLTTGKKNTGGRKQKHRALSQICICL